MPGNTDDVRRDFDAWPKSRYWRRTSHRAHPEATPERIMATLQHPDLPVEYQPNGMMAYRKYLPNDKMWFRVVLNADGALYTAFKDSNEMRKRGMLP